MNVARIGRLTAALAVVSTLFMVTTVAGAAPSDPPKNTLETLGDTIGEVLNSLLGTPLKDARGDITKASVEHGGNWLKLDVDVGQFTSPVKDPNWESGSTWALWSLDTNGDAVTDYNVEYGVSEGELYGSVFRPTDQAETPPICSADSVTFSTSGRYSMVLNPECIGRPASFTWMVEMSYDTNVKDDKAPATDDVVPDRGFSAPVYAPSAIAPLSAGAPSTPASTQPVAAPKTTTPTAPQASPGGPTPAPAVRPGQVTTTTTAPRRAVSPPSSAAAPAGASRPIPTKRSEASPAVAQPPGSAPALAQTGWDHRTLTSAALLLAAIGLLLQIAAECLPRSRSHRLTTT